MSKQLDYLEMMDKIFDEKCEDEDCDLCPYNEECDYKR